MSNTTLVVAACTVAGLLVLFSWTKVHLNDPYYGLFHLTLNRLPSDDSGVPPTTEWLNMGYWADAKTFPEACRALALKLISAASLKEHARVLDVGHGTGESLLLLLSDPHLPRLSHLVGITSLPTHHERSLVRVRTFQSTVAESDQTKVDLYAASAVYDNASFSSHPLNPSYPNEFDSILALDCAYHFLTRRSFLEQSFVKLSSNGSIALADMCFTSSSHFLKTPLAWIVTKIFKSMPEANVISKNAYIDQMTEIGYVDVTLEDISEDVFPGFVQFLKNRHWGWWFFGWILEEYCRAGARFVIVTGKKPG